VQKKEAVSYTEVNTIIHSSKKKNILLFKRFLSYSVDTILLCIASSAIALMLSSLMGSTGSYIFVTFMPFLALFYFIYFEVFDSQKDTIGKRIFKIRVVNRQGNKISIFQSALRFLLTIFFLGLTVSLLIGLINIVMGFTRKDGCCLTDLWSNTMIVENIVSPSNSLA
jgi:uncharacterized RDD family membrane protein YckC